MARRKSNGTGEIINRNRKLAPNQKKRAKPWFVRISLEDGKRKTYGGFTSESEAVTKLSEVLNAQRTGILPKTNGETWLNYLRVWLDHHSTSIEPTTTQDYENILKYHIHPAAKEAKLERIKLERFEPLHLTRLYNTMRELESSQRRQHQAGILLGAAFKQAVRWQMIPRNVVEIAGKPKRPARSSRDMKIWSPQEAQAFLKEIEGHRLYALFYMALMTGMRIGELLGLPWSEVNFETASVRICWQMRELKGAPERIPRTKSDKSERTLPLSQTLITALQRHKARQAGEKQACILTNRTWRDTDAVFATDVGTLISDSNVRRVMHAYMNKAKVKKIRFHDFRHTYASICITRGMNAVRLSRLLGHAAVSFTMDTYAHLFAQHTQEDTFELYDLPAQYPEGQALEIPPEV